MRRDAAGHDQQHGRDEHDGQIVAQFARHRARRNSPYSIEIVLDSAKNLDHGPEQDDDADASDKPALGVVEHVAGEGNDLLDHLLLRGKVAERSSSSNCSSPKPLATPKPWPRAAPVTGGCRRSGRRPAASPGGFQNHGPRERRVRSRRIKIHGTGVSSRRACTMDRVTKCSPLARSLLMYSMGASPVCFRLGDQYRPVATNGQWCQPGRA